MKYLVLVILLFLPISLIGQSTVKFSFYDHCTNSVIALWYEMTLLDEGATSISAKDSILSVEPGIYSVIVWRENEDFNSPFYFSILIGNDKTYNDTIQLPRISCWYEKVLNSQKWEYRYCSRICDGNEVDYYVNGSKWIEGTFNNGKPKGKIKYYDEDGTLIKIDIYNRNGYKTTKFNDYIRYIKNN